jgi:hypothetical protein
VLKVRKHLGKHADQRILNDEFAVLENAKTAPSYLEVAHRVAALVAVGGEEREMGFLTNHLEWSPVTVCD